MPEKSRGFQACDLLDAAETTRVLVNCRNTPIHELTAKLEEVESYIAQPVEERQLCAWLEQFCKDKSPLYDQACAAALDRESESANEATVQLILKDFEGVKAKLKMDVVGACHDLLAADAKASDAVKVQKPKRPMTAQQKKALEEGKADAFERVGGFVSDRIRADVQNAFKMAEEARQNKGFVVIGNVPGPFTEGLFLHICFGFPFVL